MHSGVSAIMHLNYYAEQISIAGIGEQELGAMRT